MNTLKTGLLYACGLYEISWIKNKTNNDDDDDDTIQSIEIFISFCYRFYYRQYLVSILCKFSKPKNVLF